MNGGVNTAGFLPGPNNCMCLILSDTFSLVGNAVYEGIGIMARAWSNVADEGQRGKKNLVA